MCADTSAVRAGTRLSILIAHAYSHKNKGDRCIVESLVRMLRRNFPDARLVVSSVDPEDVGMYGEDVWVPGLHLAALRGRSRFASYRAGLGSFVGARLATWFAPTAHPFVAACRDADLVLGCGGGYLYAKSPVNLLLCLETFRIPLALGKPVGLCAQSIGPFKPRHWQTRATRRLLEHPRLLGIHVRENVSYELLQSWNLEAKTTLVPDLALAFAPPAEPTERRAQAQRAIGFTVRNWFRDAERQRQYEQTFAQILAAVGGAYQRLAGFLQVTGSEFSDSDEPATQRVIAALPPDLRSHAGIVSPRDPQSMLAVLREMDVFVGTRMHSNILALLAGVPTVAIGYQYKTAGIMQMLGLDSYVFDITDLSPTPVIAAVERAASAGKEYFAEAGPAIKQHAQATESSVCTLVRTLAAAAGRTARSDEEGTR